MNKLSIIVALIKWLFMVKHPYGVKHSVEKTPNGMSWFLVDQRYIMLQPEQVDESIVVVDGKRYVRVGGGAQEDKYIFIGDETK